MRNLLVGLFAALLGACSTVTQIPTDYKGSDAGTVVIGIGAAAGTSYSSYALFFRRRPSTNTEGSSASAGRFVYFQDNIFSKQKPDYQSSSETGVVLVNSLPPGDYEVYNFDIFHNTGMVQKSYSSRMPFAIPFTVRTRETTYLGNYQANRMTGRNIFGMPLPAGAVFVVSNRVKSEVAIAASKAQAASASVTDATPEIKVIANPFFIAPQSTLPD